MSLQWKGCLQESERWKNRGWFHGHSEILEQADMVIEVQEKELHVKGADL